MIISTNSIEEAIRVKTRLGKSCEIVTLVKLVPLFFPLLSYSHLSSPQKLSMLEDFTDRFPELKNDLLIQYTKENPSIKDFILINFFSAQTSQYMNAYTLNTEE